MKEKWEATVADKTCRTTTPIVLSSATATSVSDVTETKTQTKTTTATTVSTRFYGDTVAGSR
jgi:hypothetical protein